MKALSIVLLVIAIVMPLSAVLAQGAPERVEFAFDLNPKDNSQEIGLKAFHDGAVVSTGKLLLTWDPYWGWRLEHQTHWYWVFIGPNVFEFA